MELFKFASVTSAGVLSEGVYINGIKSAMWVERYRDPGEFEIKAPVSSGLRTFLPIGTLISHVNTREVMMVETIELDENVKDTEPILEIKGRSLESWLKQRNVGEDIETFIFLGDRHYVNMNDYALAFDTSWAQAVQMLEDHITAVFNVPNDEVSGFVPISDQQHIGPSTTEARIMRKGSLHTALLELLAIDDFGIKIIRPNAGNVDPTSTEFRIHNGVDLIDTVVFSHAFGDLEKARYFWSDIALKTEYYCISTYFQLRSDDNDTGFLRRIAIVDCTDIDGHLADDDVTDGVISAAVAKAMDIRGRMVLRMQTATNLLSTDVSKSTRFQFRKDYDVGDLVTVNGNYDISAIMRVTEHVEFQDENGEYGYPTLSIPNE